jgi:hypothetical protein
LTFLVSILSLAFLAVGDVFLYDKDLHFLSFLVSLNFFAPFGRAISELGRFEVAGVTPDLNKGTWSINDMFGLLVMDVVLYFFIALWAQKVRPGSGERGESALFCLPRHWRCGRKRGKSDEEEAVSIEDLVPLHVEEKMNKGVMLDPDLPVGDEAVQIAGLVKSFVGPDGKSKRAVDEVYLRMHSGQVTAVLGHNGAGALFFFKSLFSH